jgi:serine/threonine protein kinase
MIGKTIFHYRILEKLGEGGMGVLYKARDSHLHRFVAIKVLPPANVTDPERKRRFVQERKAGSAFNHPHIVTIHEIDEADVVHFIAMNLPGPQPRRTRKIMPQTCGRAFASGKDSTSGRSAWLP